MPRRKQPQARRAASAVDDDQITSTSHEETNGTEDSHPRKRVRWSGSLSVQDEDDVEDDEGDGDGSSSNAKEKVRPRVLHAGQTTHVIPRNVDLPSSNMPIVRLGLTICATI